MRRPQRSELTRSESCQSGPASSTTTFLPAFASVAANTEPEAPAPTMTASTFGRIAMSPPLQRHDVRLIRNAEELIALDRAVDDVDCVASHEEVDERRGRSLPALQLPLSHEIDEVALRIAWQPGEALIRLRGGSAVDRRDRRFVEIRVRRAHVHDARLEQRLFGRHPGDRCAATIRCNSAPAIRRNSVSGTEFPARSVDQLIALEERIRTGEVADIGGVADDAHAAPPGVKLERRRLHLEARRGVR